MRQNLRADPNQIFSIQRSHPSEPAGLYVHIPFCVQKCLYCDFYSVIDRSKIRPFIQALLKEMDLSRSSALTFDTLYIGGGTPSVLKIEKIGRIIESAYQSFKILPEAEITLEVNPGTLAAGSFESYRQFNINRLNIGVQSFADPNLKFLGRIHSAKEASRAIADARRAGFDNIGLDLIYGIPGQDLPSWQYDLGKALEFEPEHLSCYLLTYEPETPLYRQRREQRFRPPDEGLCGDLFEATIEFLSDQGYRQYEISNFARSPSRRSRHNQKYWSFAPFIGLGPSAHSFIEPVRHWNYRSLQKYIFRLAAGKPPIAEKEVLSREQQMIEMIYLGLRTTAGINLETFEQKFGIRFLKVFKETIAGLEQEGRVLVRANRLKLTRKGMRFLDNIAGMFILNES